MASNAKPSSDAPDAVAGQKAPLRLRMSSWVKVLGGLVSVIAAIAAVFANVQLNDLKKRAAREATYYKVYDYVVAALPSDDERNRIAARALVNAVISDDPELKRQLLIAIGQSGTTEALRSDVAEDLVRIGASAPATKAAAYDAAYQLTQASAPAAPGGDTAAPAATAWKTYRYDLFWCQGTPDTEQRARAEAAQLEAFLRDAGATGQIRVRVLPATVNAQSGYGVRGYEVRPNEDEEPAIGKLLETWSRAGRTTFTVHRSRLPTPSYVTFFFCPEG